jgi:hypothetical protein
MDLFFYLCSVIKRDMENSKKDLRPRFILGLDILILSKQLELLNEKDPRNSRASELIKKSALIYIEGGRRYEDLVNEVGDSSFEEYQGWYKKNIFDVVKRDPAHMATDYDGGPIPKYDVNKYDLGKYFDGLNKDVFEELQKMIMFLFDPKSEEVLEQLKGNKGEEDFVNHTRHFSVLAQSILIATLEGGEILDRLEKIIFKYISEEEEENILEKMTPEKFKNNNDIASIASDFLSMKNYFN